MQEGSQRMPTGPPTEWPAHTHLLCFVYKPWYDGSVEKAKVNAGTEQVLCGLHSLGDKRSGREVSHVARKVVSQERWQLMHCGVSNK